MTAPSNSKRHWAQMNESSFIFGMRLLFWIYRIAGRWPFRLVLYPVLAWYVMTKPAARHASRTYLSHVNKYVAHRGDNQLVRSDLLGVFQHFASFAENILDKMLLWGGVYKTHEAVKFGQEVMLENLKEQRGGLLICAHLGNLELCRLLAKQSQHLRITVLVHTKHAQAFNRLLAQLDPQSQLNLLQVTEISAATAIMLAEKIANGEFVAIAGDRIPVSMRLHRSRVAHAKFLGERAPFPIGPYVLASVMQCPVYLLFSYTLNQRPECHFELFRSAISLPRKNRDHMLDELATAYAERLEHYCLRAPLQWFNFYDFWNSTKYETE